MTSTIDYRNWEKLALAEEVAEKQRSDAEREERRMKHFLGAL